MTEQPKRRWFRFRLSTVLILTAIAACGMAMPPRNEGGHYHFPFNHSIGLPLSITWQNSVISDHVVVFASLGTSNRRDWWWVAIGRTSLLYTSLALLAFLAWKSAWAIGPRIVRRGESDG